MADIILKDASGDDRTYSGVNSVSFRSTTEGETVTFIAQQQVDWNQTDDTAVDFIKNKPQGLATESYVQEQIDAIGIQEGIATEAYVQEQIAKIEVSGSQVQVNWEQDDATAKDFIQNKPFGLVPAVLSPRTMQFETTEHNDILKMESVKTIKIIEGEAYIITWGDNKQELIAKNNEAPNLTFLGNISILSPELGEDTEEPFLFYNGTVRENGVESNVLTCITNDLSIFTRVVGIEPVNKEKKLSAEWLPDGIATEDFVNEKIAAIEIPEGGGGSVSTKKVILEELSFNSLFLSNYGAYGDGFNFGDTDEAIPAFSLALGDECVVVWDETEHNVTVSDASSVMADALFVGNGSGYGLSGNNEPFTVAWTNDGVTIFALTDTEPTKHTIRIYQKAPLSVSWENVTDKPFGEEVVTVFEGTFQDTLMDEDGDGVNDTWANNMIIEDTSDAALIIGETYTVIFEGVEYKLKCFNYSGLPVIGNEGLVTGTPDEVPFIIGRDITGMFGGGPGWLLTFIEPLTDLTISGVYDVKITGTVIKHLDNKYLDILEGEEKPETEIFAEQTVEGFAKATGGETHFTSWVASTISFNVGATYRVIWDDAEYEFVAEITDGVTIGDAKNYDPFCMVGVGGILGIFTSDMTATSHKIRIYQSATTETIKEKYIPIIAEEKLPILESFGDKEIEIYPENTWSTNPDEDFGYSFARPFGEEFPAFPLTIGDECIVVWDGEEYKVTVGDCSSFMPNTIFVGNGAVIGLSGNNEPFLIGWQSVGVTFAALTDTEPTEHTVRIYQKIEGNYKIKESYIPDSVKLPIVTAEDNGKVLGVVDGVWSTRNVSSGGSSLPEATTEDNNKFLRIVDGVPTWVSLTDVSTEGA